MGYSLRASTSRRQRSPSSDFEPPTPNSVSSGTPTPTQSPAAPTRFSTPFNLRSKRARSVGMPEDEKGKKESQTTWTKSGQRCQGPAKKAIAPPRRSTRFSSAQAASGEASSSGSPEAPIKPEESDTEAFNSDGDIVVPPPPKKKAKVTFDCVEITKKKETSMAATDSSYTPDIQVGPLPKPNYDSIATNSNAIASGSGSNNQVIPNTSTHIDTNDITNLTEAEIIANLNSLLFPTAPPPPPPPPPLTPPQPSFIDDPQPAPPPSPKFPTSSLTQISTLLHSLSPYSHLSSYAPNFFRIGIKNGDDLLELIEVGLDEEDEVMRGLEEEEVPVFERKIFWRAVKRKREEMLGEGRGGEKEKEKEKEKGVEESASGGGKEVKGRGTGKGGGSSGASAGASE